MANEQRKLTDIVNELQSDLFHAFTQKDLNAEKIVREKIVKAREAFNGLQKLHDEFTDKANLGMFGSDFVGVVSRIRKEREVKNEIKAPEKVSGLDF